MHPRLPAPPDGSCFLADRDPSGELRLTWVPPRERGRWLAAAFPSLWLCVWMPGGAFMIWNVVQGGIQADPFMILWLIGWTFGGLLVGRITYAILRKPRPEQLVLGETALRYEADTARAPSDMSFSIIQSPAPQEPPPEILREEVTEVRLDRDAARQRLTLERAAGPVEVGRHLREPEREWLAEFLRAWIEGPAEPQLIHSSMPPQEMEDVLARVPDPPSNTWIETGHGGRDQWQVRWMPAPQRKTNWSRWGGLVRSGFGVCAATVPVVIVGGLWLLAAANIAQGRGWWVVFVLVFLTPFVILTVLLWLGTAANVRALLRRYRPESLTLSPSLLAYDPGHFIVGAHAASGTPRDIPRSVLGTIKLERTNGRQQLTIDHGTERIEIGRCLREPEREWLSDVLTAWAGRSDNRVLSRAASEPYEGGTDHALSSS